MVSEQTTIKAIVRTLDGKFANVEVEHGGCGRCHEEGGCGGQQLTQMFCGGQKTYRVENTIGADIGERVTIGIAAGSVSRTANFAYILPLTVTIVGAALGALFGSDLSAIIGAGIGLSIAFLYVIAHSHGKTGNLTERPHIISRS
ncbi:SoxR reducing system RseC family protein [Ferribacterium limneticum]|uniref:SoxR reducing system RseC family protein n=1 Tax=Ferribacterium limneticum TaxID=76259 RepID=UPI001CFBE3BB|nr:SoxR reducing system RseC family protein [Ferribacterium limneticum]UCV17478.1 SoxR reducing system RseC family protein [Ferribacterium limneticum]